MANKTKHLLHARSLQGDLTQIQIGKQTLSKVLPKKPLPERIEYGELAVNFGKGHETIFLKNSEGEIIQINSLKNIRYDGDFDPILKAYFDNEYVNSSGDTMNGTLKLEGNNTDFIFNGRDFKLDTKNDISLKYKKSFTINTDGECSDNNGVFNFKSCLANIVSKNDLNIKGGNTNIQGDEVKIKGNENITIESPVITENAETYNNTSKNANFKGNVNVEGEAQLKNTTVKGDMNVEGKTTTRESEVKGDLTVGNDIHTKGLEVKDKLKVKNGADIEGETHFKGKTVFQGETEFSKDASFDGSSIKQNSITSDQIKDGSIKGEDIADNTIGIEKLNKSVTDMFVKKGGDTMSGDLDVKAKVLADELEVRNKAVITNSVTITPKATEYTDVLVSDGNVNVNGVIKAKKQIFSSDERLKRDIKPISEQDIENVSKIELKEYYFKDGKTKHYGIIAQDVETAKLNNIVFDKDENFKGVDYISFLILKIKQLEMEIEKLKK